MQIQSLFIIVFEYKRNKVLETHMRAFKNSSALINGLTSIISEYPECDIKRVFNVTEWGNTTPYELRFNGKFELFKKDA